MWVTTFVWSRLCELSHYLIVVPLPVQVKYYSTYIKNPLDFMTISKKLMRQHFNHYDSVTEFVKDMRLVFSNCVAFNGVSLAPFICSSIAVLGLSLEELESSI